eukprot:g6498.t1
MQLTQRRAHRRPVDEHAATDSAYSTDGDAHLVDQYRRFASFSPYLWPSLNQVDADEEPFGPAWDAGKYHFEKDRNGEYEGGGYHVLLPMDENLGKHRLRELREDEWVSKTTRIIFTEFVCYQATFRIFVLVQLRTEFTQTGSLSTKLIVQPIDLEPHVALSAFFHFCEGVLAVWAIYQAAIMLYRQCWLDPVHSNKHLSLGDSAGYIICRWLLIVLVFAKTLKSILVQLTHPLYNESQFALPWPNGTDEATLKANSEAALYFSDLVAVRSQDIALSFFTAFVFLVNLFFYLLPFPEIGLFLHTLSRAGTHLVMYGITMMMIVLVLAIIGYYTFGHKLKEWCTLGDSVQTLVIMVIFEYDYTSLSKLKSASSFAAESKAGPRVKSTAPAFDKHQRGSVVMSTTHAIAQAKLEAHSASGSGGSRNRGIGCCTRTFMKCCTTTFRRLTADKYLEWPQPEGSASYSNALDDPALNKMFRGSEYIASGGRVSSTIVNRIVSVKRASRRAEEIVALQASSNKSSSLQRSRENAEEMESQLKQRRKQEQHHRWSLDVHELSQLIRIDLEQASNMIFKKLRQDLDDSGMKWTDLFHLIDSGGTTGGNGQIEAHELFHYIKEYERQKAQESRLAPGGALDNEDALDADLAASGISFADVEAALRHVDTSGDGRVSAEEFEAAMQAAAGARDHQLF